jgi:hypothetical protein
MRYLKIYEDFENYYRQIEEKEFNKFKKEVKIEYSVYDAIKDKIYSKNFNCFYSEEFNQILISKKVTNPTFKSHFYIKKYEDEYYLIKVVIGRIYFINRYYLCDQKDGLFKFIEDLSSGKIKFT